MKASKILTVGILAGAALISTASAQTKIYITGSTAFRSAANAQISAVLSGTVTIASTNGTLGSANGVNWTGGNIGGTAVTIKAAWTGSAAGIQSVAANGAGGVTTKFLKDGATGTANPDPNGATPDSPESATPDVCMADNLQSTTPFLGGSLINGGPSTYQTLVDTPVGVVSFIWAASNGFPAGLSMTKKLAEAQLSGIGAIPLGFYNGALADTPSTTPPVAPTSIVYASGRNPDSGTRIITLAESGYGVSTFVTQYKPTSSGTNGSISALALYPTETINGVSTVQDGNSGENSGGTLRGYLTNDIQVGAYQNGETGPSYLITYLGVSDYNSVKTGASGVTKPAVELKWNGVSFSQDAVKTGQYTFWGYERIMWRSGISGIKATFANNLKNNIIAQTSATLNPNVALSDMRVSRSGDGGTISNPNF